MKKIVYGGSVLALMLAGFVGCQKEKPVVSNGTHATEKLANYTYAEENRSYKWVDNNTKLDCSAAGKGCTVKTKYANATSEIDLTVPQALKLMDIGLQDVNQYFLSNNLSYEFPNFYETDFYTLLSNNQIVLRFEFPYLWVMDGDGAVLNIYNYESTVSNEAVVQKMQAAGGFTKKISVNTGSGGPWKCTESGDNCKVSAVKFNVDWLAAHPAFTFAPNVSGATIVKDNANRKILVQTASGAQYGIEL